MRVSAKCWNQACHAGLGGYEALPDPQQGQRPQAAPKKARRQVKGTPVLQVPHKPGSLGARDTTPDTGPDGARQASCPLMLCKWVIFVSDAGMGLGEGGICL